MIGKSLGFRVQGLKVWGNGLRVEGLGIRVQGLRFRVEVWGLEIDVLVSGPRVYNSKSGDWTLMMRMYVSGFRVKYLWCGVEGVGFRILGSELSFGGFRAQGLGFRYFSGF